MSNKPTEHQPSEHVRIAQNFLKELTESRGKRFILLTFDVGNLKESIEDATTPFQTEVVSNVAREIAVSVIAQYVLSEAHNAPWG